MANENQKYGLRIYCIYFENKDPKYFHQNNAKDDLENIALIGNPDIKKEGNTDGNKPHYYHSNSLEELFTTFEENSRLVEKNYSLKFNEIQRE